MSHSENNGSPITPPAEPPERIPGMTLWSRLLGGAVIFLIALWVLGWQEEASRWHWAAARELYYGTAAQAKDLPAALAELDAASYYDPDNVALHLQRSKWRLEAKDFAGAMADCELLQRLVPELGQLEILQQKAEIYWQMKKVPECIAEIDRCVALVEKIYPEQRTSRDYQVDMAKVLNTRAYYRALAGSDLDAAWKDIEQALSLVGETGERPWMEDAKVKRFLGGWRPEKKKEWVEQLERMDYLSQMFDTRACLSLLRKEPAAALADMDAAIVLAEGVFDVLYPSLIIEGRTRYDRRQIDRQQQGLRSHLAIVYQHRALAHQDLGETFAAAHDFQIVKALGGTPSNELE